MNVKLHLEVKLQNEDNAHSDFEISTHERDVELPERDVHNDSEAERPNMETRKEARLANYVRRHYLAEQIIGEKEAKPMTRNKLRNESFLLRNIEPKIVRYVLQDDDW